MKNILKNYKQISNQRGFTLIELLVVITLIAILAVAVLATINPVEQRRKAADTSLKATANEYIAAQERYFTTYGCYTHNSTAAGVCPATITAQAAIARIPNDAFLVTQGEVKQSLLDRLGVAPYTGILFMVDANDSLHASFTPTSRQFLAPAECTATCTACNDGTADAGLYCVPDTVD